MAAVVRETVATAAGTEAAVVIHLKHTHTHTTQQHRSVWQVAS